MSIYVLGDTLERINKTSTVGKVPRRALTAHRKRHTRRSPSVRAQSAAEARQPDGQHDYPGKPVEPISAHQLQDVIAAQQKRLLADTMKSAEQIVAGERDRIAARAALERESKWSLSPPPVSSIPEPLKTLDETYSVEEGGWAGRFLESSPAPKRKHQRALSAAAMRHQSPSSFH